MRFIGFYDYTVILTYMSLVSAVMGMYLSDRGMLTGAVLCLVLSGICDAFDGIVARTKKNRTDDEKAFGIQIDSLCDAVSFGVFPAVLCANAGMKELGSVLILAGYVLCAVIRLAFFNVLEGNRQKTEGGANKTYRGLPVTSASMLLPAAFLLRPVLPPFIFLVLLHVLVAVTAFLFILDFSMKKPDWLKPFRKKEKV